jgi:hypothetical protein
MMRFCFLSSAPGFNPVIAMAESFNRFSGFSRGGKPLKRLEVVDLFDTGLKPGANEIGTEQRHK